MTVSCTRARMSWLALAAIAGIFCASGEASAATKGESSGRARSCCVRESSADCRCCVAPVTEDRTPARFQSREPETRVARVSAPASSCECRSDSPSSPASRPESQASGHRGFESGLGDVEATSLTLPAVATFHAVRPNESPPGSPIYLRFARLLI
jgi:hypothetical protein